MKQLKGIDENTVVHCHTEELANQVLKIAHEAGYKWCTNESFIIKNSWLNYQEVTCYNITSGEYGPIQFYKEENYKILPAEEFIELNTSEETGELIGYEAPFDIPKWNTKKGDLWTYTKNGWYEFKDEALPAEWVETWKPVYKAKEKKRVPKSGWIIYDPIEQRTIFKDGKKDEPFLIQAECIYWVQQNGLLGHFYSFLEVDYITEE